MFPIRSRTCRECVYHLRFLKLSPSPSRNCCGDRFGLHTTTGVNSSLQRILCSSGNSNNIISIRRRDDGQGHQYGQISLLQASAGAFSSARYLGPRQNDGGFSNNGSWSRTRRVTMMMMRPFSSQCKRSTSSNVRNDVASEESIKTDGKLQERKEQILNANRRMKEKGKVILDDLKDTKQQMKDKVGEMMARENVWTVPNALCLMRMGMAPVLAYMILQNQYGPAIGLFLVAGATDWLDGWIARVVPGQSSVMGSFLDPMADKILVGTLFISLTYVDLIPVPLTALIIGRDAILVMAGFYIRYQSLDPPRTFSRYFDVTHPTAQLAPTFISKVNTGVQLGLVGATLLSTILPYDAHPFLQVLWYCTAATTTLSAVGYVFAKDTVKLLRKKKRNVETAREQKRKSRRK